PSYGTDNHRLDDSGVICHQIDFVRSPYSAGNIKVYKQLKQLMESVKFEFVHCHTPMGGVMTRMVAYVTNTKPVIYTAHGFHFFKGAPLLNWLCYYPVEKWLSRHTNQLICINHEDYCRAKKFYAKYTDYIPGVGICPERISKLTEAQILEKKKELGIPTDKKILLSAGELIKRKNHEAIIRTMAKLQDPSLVYVICGHGVLMDELKQLAVKLKVDQQVIFTGYREDIMEVYQIADLYIFPSWQEGLPMALLEAMACERAVVCSEIRGSSDLMGKPVESHERMGWSLYDGGAIVKKADDTKAYADSIRWCLEHPVWRNSCGARNKEEAKNFTLDKVEVRMRKIYERASRKNSV
ncbi:MAG: glycosyltransferase, partial [Lachnospiraceae bacterium]|nr:glycosyltransferase [Lachnospiraceae bacterium]